MKRFVKIFVNLLVAILLAVTCLSFVACEEIKVLDVTFSIYNTETKKDETKTIQVELYRHLAPQTVDAVISAAEQGYYNDAIIYKFKSTNANQYMVGDLKYVDEKIVQNDMVMPQIKGEFDSNGVVGSNLTSKYGSIGIWRDWYEYEEECSTTAVSNDSGRAVWYMPTDELPAYNRYYCVFAQIDLEDDTVQEVFSALSKFFGDASTYEDYTVYYTGEYQDDDSVKNNGLEFNVVRFSEFVSDDVEDLFEADGKQYTSYNKHDIRVPFSNKDVEAKKAIGAKIVSVTLAK